MQEITMIVLKIYVYVMSSDTENPKLYEDYDTTKKYIIKIEIL